MIVAGNGCILGGGHGDVVVGRVVSEGQWGFVLVVDGTHDSRSGFAGRGNGKRDRLFAAASVRLLCLFGRSFFVGVSAIEVGDKFWGVFQMLHRFPGAVARGETFPLYQVMEFAPSALSADFLYFLGFVLLFSIDKVRWRSGEVRAV